MVFELHEFYIESNSDVVLCSDHCRIMWWCKEVVYECELNGRGSSTHIFLSMFCCRLIARVVDFSYTSFCVLLQRDYTRLMCAFVSRLNAFIERKFGWWLERGVFNASFWLV